MRALGTGDGDGSEGDKGTAGDRESQGAEPGRAQQPREGVAKPSSFLGGTSLLQERAGKIQEPTAGTRHPEFPPGLECSFGLGEVGKGLVLSQPPAEPCREEPKAACAPEAHLQPQTHGCMPQCPQPALPCPLTAYLGCLLTGIPQIPSARHRWSQESPPRGWGAAGGWWVSALGGKPSTNPAWWGIAPSPGFSRSV